MPTVNGYVNPGIGDTDWTGINTTLASIENALPPADSAIFAVSGAAKPAGGGRTGIQSDTYVEGNVIANNLIGARQLAVNDPAAMKNRLAKTVIDYDAGTNNSITSGTVATDGGGAASIVLDSGHNILGVTASVKGNVANFATIDWTNSSHTINFYSWQATDGSAAASQILSYMVYTGTDHTGYYSRVSGSYGG